MDNEYPYKKFHALASYIDRIGAEQLNFRRFMVKEYHGRYYVEKTIIKINSDFSIECRDERYAPTPEEATAIAVELKLENFPTYVPATKGQVEDLRKSSRVTGELYAFPDVERKMIRMCQERREGPQGKYYIPWSCYATKGEHGMNKGEWMDMEADGDLAFWKPLEKRNKSIIMVHEGAKTAAFWDGLINDPTRRAERKDYERVAKSWVEHCADCEHWGAIGGALAMHRCDFKELHDMKIEGHLEYSCDNDTAGVEASKTFSRYMAGKEVRVIKYNNSFRAGWDLADPIPPELLDKNGRVKLRLEDMMRPATWATQVSEKKKGPGRPSHSLTLKFKEEWYHCTDVKMYFHATMPGQAYEEQAFNCFVRPYSDVEDTAKLLRASEQGKVAFPSYDPSRPYGPFNRGEGKNLYFNEYVEPRFDGYSRVEAKRLDHGLLKEYFERLIPDDEDRHKLIKWVATVCVCPHIKMDYAALVVSEEHGVGKSTLGNLMRGIVGECNTSQPNEKALTDERNSWAAKKRLAIIPEIYQGHSKATYNILKSLITERVIYYNEKFIAPYELPNWLGIYANSNSLAPLHFDNSDRRWLVPKCTERKSPQKFWNEFNHYMIEEDGYRRARQFFKDFIENNGSVLPGEEAPFTTTKRDMILSGYSPGQELVHEALEWIANPDQEVELNGTQSEMVRVRDAVRKGMPIIAFDRDGVDGIERVIDDKRRLERVAQPASAVCKVARMLNFYIGDERNSSRHFRKNARVLSLDEVLANTKVADLIKRVQADEVLYARLGLLMEEKGKL